MIWKILFLEWNRKSRTNHWNPNWFQTYQKCKQKYYHKHFRM